MDIHSRRGLKAWLSSKPFPLRIETNLQSELHLITTVINLSRHTNLVQSLEMQIADRTSPHIVVQAVEFRPHASSVVGLLRLKPNCRLLRTRSHSWLLGIVFQLAITELMNVSSSSHFQPSKMLVHDLTGFHESLQTRSLRTPNLHSPQESSESNTPTVLTSKSVKIL